MVFFRAPRITRATLDRPLCFGHVGCGIHAQMFVLRVGLAVQPAVPLVALRRATPVFPSSRLVLVRDTQSHGVFGLT